MASNKTNRILVSLDDDDMSYIDKEQEETGYAKAAIAASYIKRYIKIQKARKK